MVVESKAKAINIFTSSYLKSIISCKMRQLAMLLTCLGLHEILWGRMTFLGRHLEDRRELSFLTSENYYIHLEMYQGFPFKRDIMKMFRPGLCACRTWTSVLRPTVQPKTPRIYTRFFNFLFNGIKLGLVLNFLWKKCAGEVKLEELQCLYQVSIQLNLHGFCGGSFFFDK